MLTHTIRDTRINHILRVSAVTVGVVIGTQILSAYEYSIKDLGLVGRETYPGAVNDHGVAVLTAFPEGSSEDITIPGEVFIATESGWSPMIGLGGVYDVVLDINNYGSAVGHSNSGDIHATPTRAVIYTNGQAYDLGVNPGGGSYATALNDYGDVVGYASFAGEQHAFLYMGPGNIIDLGTPGFSSAAYDINEVGQVIGSSRGINAEEQFFQEGFLYTNGQMTTLGTLGGRSSSATAINNLGQIVGSSLTEADEYHAFIYDSTEGMRDIGPLGLSSVATDINDHGVMVGTIYSLATGKQGVVFDQTGDTTLLQDLIPPDSGWTSLFEPRSINSRGQILGEGVHDGEVRIFLMTPISVPEPSVVALTLLGAVVCAGRRGIRLGRGHE